MRAAKAVKEVQQVAEDLANELGQYFEDEVDRLSPSKGDKSPGDARASFMDYLTAKVVPLLKVIASGLLREQPSRPEVLACLLLAEQLKVPKSTVQELRDHLQDDSGEASGAIDTSAKTPSASPSNRGILMARVPDAPKPPTQSPNVKRVAVEGFGSDDNDEDFDKESAAPMVVKTVSIKRVALNLPLVPGMGEGSASLQQQRAATSASPASGGKSPFAASSLSLGALPLLARSTSAADEETKAALDRLRGFIDGIDLNLGDGGVIARTKKRIVARPTTIKEVPKYSQDQILKAIRNVPIFGNLAAPDLEKVAGVVELRSYDQDENVVSIGDAADCVHIIMEGEGKLSVLQAAGVLKSGEFVGEEALKVANAGTSAQLSVISSSLVTASIRRDKWEELGFSKKVERRKQGAVAKSNRPGAADGDEGEGFGRQTSDRPDKNEHLCPASGLKLVKQYIKTDMDRDLIINAVKSNKVLGEVVGLSQEQCEMVANSVYLVEVPANTYVFREGDVGNALFIVHYGFFQVTRNGESMKDLQLRIGDTFGELALLYDEPRLATVQALRESKLWVLSRQAFQSVSKISAQKHIEKISKLLQKVPALKEKIEAPIFNMLAGVVEETVFVEGDDVCVAGEDAGSLFCILEGECLCSGGPQDGVTLKSGDWIGEEQLLQKIPATSTVTVASDLAEVLVLTHGCWQLVLGAAEENKDLDAFTTNQVKKVVSNLRGRSILSALRGQKEKVVGKVQIDNCEMVGALGQGSYGSVVLLRDKMSKQEYALKGMSKAHLKQEDREAMFENERNVLLLMDSTFIVRLYNTYQDPKHVYLLLEPCLGGELFDIYSDQDLWGSVAHAQFYVACVVLGLGHMHGKRVVWRDLKLENCLLNSQGYLKLTDLGIAKLVVGKTYTVCGTPDYFAPETLKQVGHNRAVDWWACGVMLFMMLTGRSPFDAPEVSQIYKNIIKGIPKVAFPPSCPSDGEELVRALCKKKPEDRVPMQRGGVRNLMGMRFFDNFKWEELLTQVLPPPYVPSKLQYEVIEKRTLDRELAVDWGEIEEWDEDKAKSEQTIEEGDSSSASGEGQELEDMSSERSPKRDHSK